MSEGTEITAVRKKRIPALPVVAVLVVVAAIVAFVFAGAPTASADAKNEESKDKAAEKVPIPVETAAVELGKISSYLSSTANLVPENEVRVISEWEGRLSRLNVEEGQAISKGQILGELVRGDAEIMKAKAKVRAENAKVGLDRADRLKAQELISNEAYDKVQMESRVADQELAEADWRLEKTYIRSPFSGVITGRTVQPGQHIRPGDELFVVADFDPLVARIYMPEKDVLALEEGRPVRLALRADEKVHFDGRIRQISPVVDTATGTVKVTVEVVHAPKEVRPGAFIRVDIVKDTKVGALLVPREAVVRELQSTFVFLAENGVAHKKPVSLGLEENGKVEVQGLAAGDRVVVAGQGGLKDGATIKLLG
jgi:membrane fusion protein (multidrug efflux system)